LYPFITHVPPPRGGGRVDKAQVGDPLELHFTILDLDSPYEVFVRELVAKVPSARRSLLN
jgi:hypothetical protein